MIIKFSSADEQRKNWREIQRKPILYNRPHFCELTTCEFYLRILSYQFNFNQIQQSRATNDRISLRPLY